MAIYCVPPKLAEILKAKVQKDDIAKLFEKDSQGRREYWEQFVDKENAKLINTEFEKSMVSSRRDAMKTWAERTFSTAEKKAGKFRSVVDKINELEEAQLLTPENQRMFLEDLIAEKLGARVSAIEAQRITEKTALVRSLSGKMDENMPSLPSVEFFNAKRDLDNYLDSLTPSSQLKVLTSVIGRATMLASFKSPLVNIESNTIHAVMESAARRIELVRKNNLLPKGASNPLYTKYLAYVNKVYAKTGYDVSRMISLESGRKRLGEEIVHSQGTGAVRKVGRAYTDVVFNKLMTAPDVAFASYHFADTANLKATIIARSEGLSGERLNARVQELFMDATRLEPQTPQGRIIREKARIDAERGTYTNPTNYSKIALKLRSVLNEASGDLRLGDQLMPFVQVPATVIGTALDYSGTLLPGEIAVRAIKGLNAKHKGEPEAFKSQFDQTFWRKATRAGVGLTTAFILSSWFTPDDFIGNYPTSEKERQLLALNKASENSLKIGDKWISLDYFGALAAPFIGIMYAKKYGSNPADTALSYAIGSGMQAGKIPGFKQFYDIYGGLAKAKTWLSDPAQIAEDSQNAIVDFFRARTVPAIVSDLAKGTDTFERQTDSALDRFLNSFPVVREKLLKEKLNVFGEKVETEGFWSSMLAGSRLKTATDEPVINELNALATTGNLPSITNVEKTSPRAKALKKQIGEDEFRKFYIEFGNNFKQEIADLIETDDYKGLTDSEKKTEIDGIKDSLFNDYLDQYGYEKPE